MRSSKIPFCESIPDSWNEIPNRYLFEDHSVKVGGKSSEYQLLSLTTSGVKEKSSETPGGKVPESYDNYQTVEKGDMIFCLFDLDCSAVFSGLSNYDGMITSAYDVFRPNTKYVDQHYLDYWFQYVFSHRYYKMYSRSIRYTVTREAFNGIITPVPPLAMQKEIGSFLDKKCAQIDALIANQEKQIEKLKQYKQALITEVVTKGLDPTVPMKDSGVEWIGKINASYFVRPLKYLLQEPMMYGASGSGTKTNDYYRYIRITDIDNDGNLKHTEDDQYLDQIKGALYELQDGDLLFARSGGTVGKTFLYRSDYGRSAFAGYLIKGSCNKAKLLPEYLYYYTQSSLYALWKESIFVQSTIQNIGANRYSMLPVITPSISEQYTIVSFIKAQCHYIDLLIDKKLQKNEKLNQYKKSLIYEYVTGKKEVV